MPPKRRARSECSTGSAESLKVSTVVQGAGVDVTPEYEEKVNRARAEFETEFGVRLPEEYVSLCGRYTNPRLQRQATRLPGDDESRRFFVARDIESIASSTPGRDRTTPWSSTEMKETWGFPDDQGKFILISGDGHVWLALSYHPGRDSPSVVALLQFGEGGGRKQKQEKKEEDEEEEEEEDGWEVLELAPTFGAFLDNLEYIDEDGAGVVLAVPSSEESTGLSQEDALVVFNRLLAPTNKLAVSQGSYHLSAEDVTVGGSPKVSSLSAVNNTLTMEGAGAGNHYSWLLRFYDEDPNLSDAAMQEAMRLLEPSFVCSVIARPFHGAVLC